MGYHCELRSDESDDLEQCYDVSFHFADTDDTYVGFYICNHKDETDGFTVCISLGGWEDLAYKSINSIPLDKVHHNKLKKVFKPIKGFNVGKKSDLVAQILKTFRVLENKIKKKTLSWTDVKDLLPSKTKVVFGGKTTRLDFTKDVKGVIVRKLKGDEDIRRYHLTNEKYSGKYLK